MSDSHARVHTLFRSDLIHVFDYRCTGHDDQGEIPQGYEIVLPRSGAYQRRDRYGTFLADPNHVLFYNEGEPYDITHPIRGEDSSTVFLLTPSLLREIVRERHRDVENNAHQIFRHSHILLHTRLQFLQYQLLRAPRAVAEPLAIEEQIVSAVDEIVAALYRGRLDRRNRITTRNDHYDQTQTVKTFLNVHLRSRLQLEQVSSAVQIGRAHV